MDSANQLTFEQPGPGIKLMHDRFPSHPMKTRLSVTSLPHCYPWAVVSTTYIRHRMKNVGMIWVSQRGICVNSTCSIKREQTS